MNNIEQRVPFLGIEGKIRYLAERHYFPGELLEEIDENRLAKINFHYFLGYARNFRALHDKGALNVQKSPSEVFESIDLDAEMASYIYRGIRNVELRLRQLFVDELCRVASPYRYYLQPDNYQLFDMDYSPEILVDGLVKDISLYRESFVVEHIALQCGKRGIAQPRGTDRATLNSMRELVQELPIWATVDSFTLGHLNRAIMTIKNPKDSSSPLWKGIAKSLDFKAERFDVACRSLLFLRNQIAHHNRLWMRPTADTPTKSGLFRKKMNDADPKAMVVAFYNLASLHGRNDAKHFAAGFEDILERNPAYSEGIRRISGSDGRD